MIGLKKYAKYFILVLFALVPIIWFAGKGDVLITGLDSNFPLDPLVWFRRRLFVWNSSINGGIDFSSSASGLFFHLVQLIPYLAHFNLKTVELASLVFWFGAVVFSAYALAIVVAPKNFMARLLFVVFYSFNIYLFNTWENVKVSNLALVVALPLFLAALNRYINSSISFRRFLLYAAISSLFASGTGINPAYFIALVVGITLYFFASLLTTKTGSKKIFFGYTVTLAMIFLVNSFWILPFINELFFASPVRNLADLGRANWLNSLSENTSIVNVIRLQGAWDWYAQDASGQPLYIPYSLNFFRNPIFILFSFAVPFLALLSFVIRGKDKAEWYFTFAIFLLGGIFLGAGSHEPTGSIYRVLVDKLPFFSFFRSPWYIFTPYLTIAYAGLLALLYDSLTRRFKVKTLLSLFGTLLVIGQLVYSYPLITGKIFRPGRYDSFYVSFPEYVWQAKDWLEKDSAGTRIVTYPDDDLEVFLWGYRGTESILGLFSSRDLVTPSFNFTNKQLGLLLDRFYIDVKRGDYKSAFATLPFLGADTVFTKQDSSSLSRKIDLNDPEVLAAADKIAIGEWAFLKYKNEKVERFFSPDYAYINLTGGDTFAFLAKTLNPKTMVINAADSEVVKINEIEKKAGHLIKTTRKESDYVFTVTKDGAYSFYLETNGSKNRDNEFGEIKLLLNEKTEIGRADSKEPGFIKFGPVNLLAGDHKIRINFPEPENLIKVEDYRSLADATRLRPEELPVNPGKTLVIYDQDAENRHFLIPVSNFDPFLKYELSFDYKYFYGNVPILDLIQSASTAPVQTYPRYVGSSLDWEHKSFAIDPIKVDSKIEIFVKPGSNLGSRSKTFMENIVFSRIYDNELFVKSESPAQIVSPVVTYRKVNPTEYLVEVETSEPYFLIFLENYHPGWQIESIGFETAPVHFIANGYANAWYFQPKVEKQSFKVIYTPQRYFNIGMTMSLSVLGISFLLSLISLRRKAKHG